VAAVQGVNYEVLLTRGGRRGGSGGAPRAAPPPAAAAAAPPRRGGLHRWPYDIAHSRHHARHSHYRPRVALAAAALLYAALVPRCYRRADGS
jgi:hypothetical protein